MSPTLGVRREFDFVLPSLIKCLDEVEDLRASYVRGAASDRNAAGHRALALLAQMRAVAPATMQAR